MADRAGKPVEPDHDQRVAGSDVAQQARQHRTRAVSIFLPGFSQPFDVSVKAAAGLSGSTQHAITARHWNPCCFADLDAIMQNGLIARRAMPQRPVAWLR
jgi:hypothetical protein